MSSDINLLSESEIAQRLHNTANLVPESQEDSPRFPPEIFHGSPQSAAVLVPLLRNEDRWEILFTRRTATLPEHSGQVAFPGGRAESDDPSPEVTALRETEEEINLSPADVQVLGRLEELHTISNYCVIPVIGRIPWPYNFRLAREEVSRIFTIPIEWLADPSNHKVQFRDLPPPYPPAPVIYFNYYDSELLWGISAEITLNLLKSLQLL
jgi:8-oxo-dGTP pyrophosphatase MutT (NUDIX family)